MARRDWDAIRAAYLAGVEPAALAQRFSVPAATIASRASRQGWTAERKQIAQQVQRELPAAVADALLDQAVEDGIMTRDEVLRELSLIARGGMRRVAAWGAHGVRLLESDELVDGVDGLVAEVSETPTKHGPAVRLKLFDRLAALRELAKFHGITSDATAINGKGAAETGVIELPALEPPPEPPADEHEEA